jgi:hypothetical protein
MKNLIGILMMSFCFHAFGQVGIGIGMGGPGYGMGVTIPAGGKGAEKSQKIDEQAKQMKHDLNLSKKQEADVRGLLVERDRRSNGANHMQPQEFNQRLDEILTPEQRIQLRELREKHHETQPQQQPAERNEKQPAPKGDTDDVYN